MKRASQLPGRTMLFAGFTLPFARFFQRLARFQQALETGQDMWPSVRHGLDELRAVLLDFVNDSELHRLALGFQLISQPRITFRFQFRAKFIAPLQHEASRWFYFNDFAAVSN